MRLGWIGLTGLALIGGATVAVLLAYNQEIGRARALAAGAGTVVSTAVGLVEYAETGAGIPLLSIHGAGGGYDQGLTIAADLVGDGFRVIAPSRFGYLRTPIPADQSAAAGAEAHFALLRRLAIDRAIVVGTSAGARSALELALRHPDAVAALVLLVPATYAPTSPVRIEESGGSQLAFWLVNAGADFAWWAMAQIAPTMLIRFLGVPAEALAAVQPAERERAMTVMRSVLPLSQRFAGINIDSTPDLRPLPLEGLRVPTLIVSARDDLFNTLPAAEFAASAIPGAKLVVYESGGHLLIGREREVRATVGEFLAEAWRRPVAAEARAGAIP